MAHPELSRRSARQLGVRAGYRRATAVL